MAIIDLGIVDNPIHHVDFDKTKNEASEKLENLFGSKVNSSKVFLKQRLFKLNQNDYNKWCFVS